MADIGVIRRKLAAARVSDADGGPGADRGWRLSLARAARDALNLELDVTALALDRRSLSELLELPPHRALIAVLEGPGDGLGLMVIGPAVLAGMTEQQTIGRVTRQTASQADAPRRPTRTDAAMVAGLIDTALIGLEKSLAEEADLVWAGGFRYASFLDDPRPLGLLLDDTMYRVLRAEVSLALGAKSGEVMLALPADGRGKRPVKLAAQPTEQPGPAFTAALADRLAGAGCSLEAVLTRVSLPLSAVMNLRVGEVLPLPTAALNRISIEGIDGRRLAEGKLGQNRGMRAIRLTEADGVVGNGHVAQGSVIAAAPGVLQPRQAAQLHRPTGTGGAFD